LPAQVVLVAGGFRAAFFAQKALKTTAFVAFLPRLFSLHGKGMNQR
jgi:hypothetical protein